MKRALMLASVASMIDQFNMRNIGILEDLGYQVDVCCNFEFGSTSSKERVEAFRKELEERGIRTIQVPIPRKILACKDIKNAYRQVKNLVETGQYDLVHCHSPIGGVIARLACKKQRKKGLKLIYTAHGFHFFDGAPWKNWLLFYPVEKYLARYTDVLITICGEDYQRALKKMPAKKVVYVPGVGVDCEAIRQTEKKFEKRNSLGITEQDILLLNVGELNVGKNQSVILNAIARLGRKEVHLAICGQGAMEQELQELAKALHIEKQVHLLGFCTDVKEWLAIADIFVFPSLREGLPVSVMEAMAMGLPVVGSRIRGNTDLVEENAGGYLCDSTDVEKMKLHMKTLCDNEELRKMMGAYNQEKMKAFDRKVVDMHMEKIYKEIGE